MSSSDTPRGETRDLAPRQPAGEIADFSSLGDTGIGATDIEMPRLKLLQGLSQPVADQKAPQGTYWNSLTEDAYGDAVLFVPIVGFKNRVFLKVGEGLKCRSVDMENGVGDPGVACATCSLKDWPEDRRKRGEDVPASLAGPECRVSHNWLVLIVGGTGLDGKPGARQLQMFEEPHWAVLAWTGTATKAAKKLNGFRVQQMTTRPGSQWHDRTYKLGADNVRGAKGNYFVPNVLLHGPTTEQHKEAAKSLAQFMAGKQITYEYSPEDVPEEAAAPAATAAGVGTDTEF